MARYTGPTTRISRRFGVHLLGSAKALERRNYVINRMREDGYVDTKEAARAASTRT